MCHDREWGILCADGGSWGQNAAHVMCNEAGIPSASLFDNVKSTAKIYEFSENEILLCIA